MGKRKRSQGHGDGDRDAGRDADGDAERDAERDADAKVRQAVLAFYYPRLLSLRTYLLELLPASSKARRRRIELVGREKTALKTRQRKKQKRDIDVAGDAGDAAGDDSKEKLADLLDSTIVGISKPASPAVSISRQRELAAFTQSQALSSNVNQTDVGASTDIADLINFAIYSLFNPAGPQVTPQHILSYGYQRAAEPMAANQECGVGSGIPGVVPKLPNRSVSMLKRAPWTDVMDMLGDNSEDIMLHLLLDCGLFIRLQGQSYYQLSGTTLSSMEALDALKKKDAPRKPNEVVFVRRRMFYSLPALNAKGEPKMGLQHIHVLNRYPETSISHTVHVMKHIFPRQFGLHNVFTSTVSRTETSMPFKDYSLREQEIALKPGDKIPRRLRGRLVELIQRMQKRHARCSYVELLRHYCPKKTINGNERVSMTDYATPTHAVSAFCRAVLQKVIPHELYGCGEDGLHNRAVVMRNVDRFLSLRRFETMSLHEAVQGLRIGCVAWLSPPSQQGGCTDQGQPGNHNHNHNHHHTNHKLALSDYQKRTEIFLELIYYLFDSLLIPLVRSNFYLTESSTYKHRLFYFRHDVWKRLSEPVMVDLKSTLFQDIKHSKAERLLNGESLGYCHIRLLPKAQGARPIANLRRRPVLKNNGRSGQQPFLGSSINSQLDPLFQVLCYERDQCPESVGSGLSSTAAMYPRLKRFKEQIKASPTRGNGPLYFVKLDVQACFDTIPQARLMQLVDTLVVDDSYRLSKHAEFHPSMITSGPPREQVKQQPRESNKSKPTRRFVWRAAASDDFQPVFDAVSSSPSTTTTPGQCSSSSSNRKSRCGGAPAVYVDNGWHRTHTRDDLLALLEKHIRNNLVKIGKKYYRQKRGIPQGSVVSNLLCDFFYGQHEEERLGFLREPQASAPALLMRYVDDYLLISTDRRLAERFLQVMLDGDEEFGISVAPEKTLVNFDVDIAGRHIPRLEGRQLLFCGALIDVKSLALTRDRSSTSIIIDAGAGAGAGAGSRADRTKGKNAAVSTHDSLTVNLTRPPGQEFTRKALKAFQLQAQTMFLDTKHSSSAVVLASLFRCFAECALKTRVYYQVMQRYSSARSCSPGLLISTITAVLEYGACRVRTAPAASGVPAGFECSVTPRQVRWLGATAFRRVLSRRQSYYAPVLRWLDALLRACRPSTDREHFRLRRAVAGP
ncbi:Telomerase reverse transcriptase [Trichophyton interdigitale]|uniref:Telomerase reverse transcriptase n=1 Tax=Trichophyton interdigitale TaxID=101480 RepID=A0A9P4YP12_9EURO|nr:Telomerase reverse transcriptase [Trichophyton interdigitale]KAG5207956.1 Telomerase reverse transcriptase [Trichophyton interdigitale]KAG8212364.1 Telomerase reverse transcriptase [Trichophyton interdigitale]